LRNMGRLVKQLGYPGVVVLAVSGCGQGRPARVIAPAIDVEAVTAAMFTAADTDGNARLEDGELATVPAIATAAVALDTDGDKGVSRQELAQWLDEVSRSKVAITTFETVVRHRGRPLAGVLVKLVPEPFMGGEIKAAEGTTDADGLARVTIPGGRYPGVNCGMYRVEITGKGNDGRPLPARYSSTSTLGVAVGGPLPEQGMALFELKDD
jgi:hypothetical protein